jgi:Mg2+/Co2+ transporter CorB
MEHDFWLKLAGYVTLIGVSAFFAGAETALTAASKARMHVLETEGNERAALVNKLRENKEKLIGGLLLGNTLSHVAASALATSVLIQLFGATGVVYATFVVSVMLLIFGEVVPKTYAMVYADRMSLFIAPMINFFLRILFPFIYSVEKSVHATFRLFGVKPQVSADEREEELRGAIDLLGDQGEEEEGVKKAMLRSILDLADVHVEKIMVHRKNVRMINIDQPAEKIVDEVLRSSFTRMPVWRESQDNIIGILHTKLLLQEIRNSAGNMAKINLSNAMMEPWFIPESTTLFDQLQEFRRRREHFAVMVDEYGALMGVVTLEDILEEIVGQIDDEHDIAVTGVRPQPDGSFLVDGKVTIRDLNREMDWGLPDEDYSTVAGLVLFESQRIPQVGQTYSFYDFHFEILKKQRNQITLLRVIPPREDGEEGENDKVRAVAG